jgi:hypothetical protein
VREHAEQRVFGNIGALLKYKRKDPSIIIALAGCMAGEPHVAERIKKSFPYVSIVADSRCLWRFPEYLFGVLVNGKREFAVGGEDVIAEGLPVHKNRDVKGWLPVMYGCDNFCSYCIVPYVRGRERSRSPETVEKQFEEMKAKLGVKENSELYRLGSTGGFYRKVDADLIIGTFKRHQEERQNAIFTANGINTVYVQSMIYYEMCNHEFAINHDGREEVLEACNLTEELLDKHSELKNAWNAAHKQYYADAERNNWF